MAQYKYSAFGKCEILHNEENIANINPFRFKCYYYDVESDMYYCHTRYYVPEWGRWLNADDIDYLKHDCINRLNLFAYCCNDPINCLDPEGTWSWKKFFKGLQKIVTAVVVVVAVVAVTAVTAGAAAGGLAVALGASTAIASCVATTVTATAAVAGIVVGCGEIANQCFEKGADKINIGSIAVATFGATIDGALIGGNLFTGPIGTALIGAGRVAASAGTSILYGLSEGYSKEEIISNTILSSILTAGVSALGIKKPNSWLTASFFLPFKTGLIKGAIQLFKLYYKFGD